MPNASDESLHNRFLLALPKAARERLWPSLHRVALLQGEAIGHVDGPIPWIYFVDQGFVSIVKTMQDGRSVEIGGVGIEGLTTPNALLGSRASALMETMVQVPGSAFRIERAVLKREMEADPVLAQMVEDYARFMVWQIAQTAACNRLHSMEQRCCRWLLIAADNSRSRQFSLTQEFLAIMLGVHRPGISMIARTLKKAGLIDYSRGQVTILDRAGLKEEACECYAAGHAEIQALYRASEEPGEAQSQSSR